MTANNWPMPPPLPVEHRPDDGQDGAEVVVEEGGEPLESPSAPVADTR